MAVKTILWPTDLSENSLKAAPKVAEFSDKFQAKVILLYVALELENYFPAYGGPSLEQAKEFQGYELKEAEKRMQRLCDEELNACPGLDVRVTTGKPADKIVAMARDEGVDLIIMASTGYGTSSGDEDYPFGSTADKVVRRSPVDVHVVRTR